MWWYTADPVSEIYQLDGNNTPIVVTFQDYNTPITNFCNNDPTTEEDDDPFICDSWCISYP